MHNGHSPMALRRSSRVPTALPILVTTLAGTYFSEVCKTVVVNAHGCAMLSPVKLDAGIPLRFHHKDGRETTAHVVSCQPMAPDNRSWRLAAKLDRPENFWGLNECPEDWSIQAASLPQVISPSSIVAQPSPARASDSREATLDLIVRRLESPMRRMIADSLSPIQAEVAAVKEKLVKREANPSRFEVSLSSIPPELEQQLESRLRTVLTPKVIEESRNQYTQLLETAKAAIDQRIKQGSEDFVRRASEELKAVERKTQDISAQISAAAREQVRHGLEDFQQKLLDGGNALKRLSEELAEYQQQNLRAEHNACHTELEQLRASVSAESTRLRKDVEGLDSRVAKLDESARSLESGLDKRLSQMSSNTLSDVRSQIEAFTSSMLEELTANSMKIVETRLSEASESMAIAQKDVIASASGSIDNQKTKALQTFEQSIDEVAKLSVERWRKKLSDRLNALAKNVGEQFE